MTRILAPLLAAFLATSAAHAGSLDRALLARAGQVLEQLDTAGHKSVGVLPFRIKKGVRPASHDAAPLYTSLPGRLENALILLQGSDKAGIRVLRGCSRGAGAWHSSRAELARLFTTTYDVAWGGGRLKPSAFLTGEVALTNGEARISIEILEPGKTESRKAASFKVDADLDLLRDLGLAFAMDKPNLAEARAQVQLDEKANKPAAGRTPDGIAGMRLEVLFDGVPQKLSLTKQGHWQVQAPRARQIVSFALTRLAPRETRLAALLRVDGRSTFAEEEDEPALCRKWQYGPKKKGKRDILTGFYSKTDGDKLAVRTFSLRGAEASWIDLDVFGVGKGLDEGPESRMTTRALSSAKSRTLKELQARLARANHLHLANFTSRRPGLILLNVDPAPINDAPTSDPILRSHLGGLTIRIPPLE